MSGTQPKQISELQMTLMNVLRGGLAGCLATTSVIPLDVTKTYMQLQSEAGAKNISIGNAMGAIFKTKGIKGYYSGLDSALCRQFIFAGIRIGLFFNVVDIVQKRLKRVLSVGEKMAASLTVGAIGAFLINPFDVVMVRSWADIKRPPNERRNYKNILDGIVRIYREEGITTLWRASTPNIIRGVGFNVGMMTTYQEMKERLKPWLGDTFSNQFISSVFAGIVGTILCLPFDNVKVKLVNMKADANGKMPYAGIMDCMRKSIAKEGVIRLWAGFIPVSANLGPHSIIALLSSEFLRKQMVKFQLLPQ